MRDLYPTKLIRVRESDLKYLLIIETVLTLRYQSTYTHADTMSWLINLAHDHDPEMRAQLERNMGDVLKLQPTEQPRTEA
jgi:hypothetical protein